MAHFSLLESENMAGTARRFKHAVPHRQAQENAWKGYVKRRSSTEMHGTN